MQVRKNWNCILLLVRSTPDRHTSLLVSSPCVPRTANTYGLIKTTLTRRKKRQGGLEDLAAAGGLIARRVPAAGADVDVCIL